MDNIKVIKTEEDHRLALETLERLMSANPAPGSPDADKVQLLATLIEDYETNRFPETLPDPIEAILFRMEQEKLSPSDLVGYIGSKSKVSEVLSGKRPLTLKMIRALENNLGIPAKVLIQEPSLATKQHDVWRKDIVNELINRGYLSIKTLKDGAPIGLLNQFFSFLNTNQEMGAMLRQSSYRIAPASDKQALAAWFGCVLKKSKSITTKTSYKQGLVTLDFMRKVAKLSTEENAPIIVRDFLAQHGIILVIEPHFARTRLDGAAIMVNRKNPIIGLTLRYDRLDNFWFTLMHELAHISLHFGSNTDIFLDELDELRGLKTSQLESEADTLASEALVPTEKWEMSPAKLVPSKIAAESLARELGINVAIIAGKMRFENGFTRLSKLVEGAKVRYFFPEIIFNH